MIRIWKCGLACDLSKFFAPRQKKEGGQSKPCSPAKKDANGNQAVRRLTRILNCNFHPGDFLLTLHFDAEGLERVRGKHDTAEHQMMLFLRRTSYVYRKRGVTFRYVGMASELDEETLQPVRLHCHVVVSGDLISKPERCPEYLLNGKPLREVWGFGTVDASPVRQEADHAGLAVYLCRQARCLPDEKRWHTSRNMKKPQCVDVELLPDAIREYNRSKGRGMPAVKIGADGRLLIPARCSTLEDGAYIPAIGTHFVRFLLPEARKLKPETLDYLKRKKTSARRRPRRL